MYEELVQLLKGKADRFNYDGWVDTAVIMEQAADAIEELSREIDIDNAAMTAMDAAMPRWIPVTERLPEPFETVFVCYQREGRYGTSCGHYYIDRGTIIWKASGIIPTHWQPLPEPPKEETE